MVVDEGTATEKKEKKKRRQKQIKMVGASTAGVCCIAVSCSAAVMLLLKQARWDSLKACNALLCANYSKLEPYLLPHSCSISR